LSNLPRRWSCQTISFCNLRAISRNSRGKRILILAEKNVAATKILYGNALRREHQSLQPSAIFPPPDENQ
jgi:hypothetical protein